MRESNQGPTGEGESPPGEPARDGDLAAGASGEMIRTAGAPASPPPIAGPPAAPPSESALEPPPLRAPGPDIGRGLWVWFLVIAGLGVAGVWRGEAELSLSVTLAGAFIAAHAADLDPSFTYLHRMLSGVLIASAALLFGMLAFYLGSQPEPGLARVAAVGIAGGGAALCLLSGVRPISTALAATLFRTEAPSRTLRLAGRLVLMVLLFAFPGWAAFPILLDALVDQTRPLMDTGQMLGSVIGLSVLAFGSVGLWVRRDGRDTLARLGLGPLAPVHYLVAMLGTLGLAGLNVATEALQHRWLPDLWEHDQQMSRLIAGGLGVGDSVLLGLSAGVGEELAMRGALQPRLGIVLTSLVFAALHVHYSWYGMATIFMLGVLLGVLRRRTNTTVAILVHCLYDISAVFMAGGGVSR